MKKAKHIKAFSCLLCIFVGAFILSFTNQSMANAYCVGNETELIAALNEAKVNGADDVIKIQQGTYYGNFVYASTESFGLTVEGGYTALCASRVVDPTNTIIDGQKNGTVLVLSTPKSADFEIDGLTIQNGSVTGLPGGGLFIKSGGNITIKNNQISNNSAYYGGGIWIFGANIVSLNSNFISENNAQTEGTCGYGYCGGGGISTYSIGDLAIVENIITKNFSGRTGGGLLLSGSRVKLMNNEITFNKSIDGGGGVSTASCGNILISSNLISNNQGGFGVHVGSRATLFLINNIIVRNSSASGAIYFKCLDGYAPHIINNTISNNTSSSGGGGLRILQYSNQCNTEILNNNIFNNTGGSEGNDLYIINDQDADYVPNGTVNLLNNNFDQSANGTYIQIPFAIDPSNLNNEDPLFVDPANDDFHLSEVSPCIDAGTDAGVYDDIDGDRRPQGAGYDIGADEYVFATTLAEIIGTWPSGIWYRDVAKSKWTKMYSHKPPGDIAAGYFNADSKADVASIWSSGLWYQNGDSRGWTQVIPAAPDRITAGDITGDGRDEIIGCGGAWSSGIWSRDVAKSKWTKINPNTPIGAITAGDFNGDHKADVASTWPTGLYWNDVAAGRGYRVSSTNPYRLTAGDITGDGVDEIISTWPSGIWYRDVAKSTWTKMWSVRPSAGDEIAAGDFTGDNKADVASIWNSGLWFQNGATRGWTKVTSVAPYELTAGDVTGN